MPSYFVTLYIQVDSPKRENPRFEGRTIVTASNESTALRRGTEKIAAGFSNYFLDPETMHDHYDDVIENAHLTIGIEEHEQEVQEPHEVEIFRNGMDVANETYLDVMQHQYRAEHIRLNAHRK